MDFPWSEIIFSKLGDQFAYNPAEPMIFSSGLFLFLFAGFATIYFLLNKKDTLRILFVTLFSYYFYYKSSGLYFGLLAVVTFSDFLLAKQIVRSKANGEKGKAWLVLSLLIDLGLLAFFKYTNFFAGMLAPLWTDNFQPWDIFLPVGISFFTFQSMSYTIDVYRGRIQPLERPLDYAFYVSFFPQLVAGPIVRAADFIPQIRRPLFVTQRMFGRGVFYILIGLFKKAVISDYISVNFVERVFDTPAQYCGLETLMALYGYAMQIYCDFSGYSDMAIGLALLLGFRFPVNFDSPYKSASISEFWRRWHISLSSWLKDYIYIFWLGGNRKGKVRQYINLMLTMLLGGLWHGASLNFVLWGGLQGLALSVDKMKNVLLKRGKNFRPTGWLRVLGVLITFHFVTFSWLPFRCTSTSDVGIMLTQIFTNFQPQIFLEWIASYWAVALLMGVGYVMHFVPSSWVARAKIRFAYSHVALQALALILLIYLVVQIKSSEIQPFIYFQF